MDQTTFSFEPTANLSNDSDLGATDFSFDPDPEIDIRALLGLSAGDVSLNLDPRSTIPDGSVPPALLTLPAGDVSLNFDPGWTIPDDSVPLDLDALLAPPAGDISLSFGGPDGSMANGDYTQGFVQERRKFIFYILLVIFRSFFIGPFFPNKTIYFEIINICKYYNSPCKR